MTHSKDVNVEYIFGIHVSNDKPCKICNGKSTGSLPFASLEKWSAHHCNDQSPSRLSSFDRITSNLTYANSVSQMIMLAKYMIQSFTRSLIVLQLWIVKVARPVFHDPTHYMSYQIGIADLARYHCWPR